MAQLYIVSTKAYVTTNKSKLGKKITYDVVLLHVRLFIFAKETQQYLPFSVLLA
jgi:hypothetical protein